ncbi:hypothetical protein [Actinoplanes sp. DH11]|uniref:hypothetical protein n=1 Tax=Actinoplanes sp. DH11 TaxID=2857011 RepID=UPI001E3F13DF|nr:hypothetical protein [Actinoplanes sp. DH11]
MTKAPVVAIHGIWNRQPGVEPARAAALLAERWTTKLAAGYRDAGLSTPPPPVAAAYYADLLDDQAQGAGDELEALTPQEQAWAWEWMVQAGVPVEASQGPLTYPLRQGLDWLAQHWDPGARAIGRLMTALLREVYLYLTRPGVRARCRQSVIDAIDSSGARVVVAHSLGSVVAYEALCAHPDREIDLFVTLGSPLGLRGAVFEALDPEPVNGRAVRPAGVGRWVNIADPGDLVALPNELGGAFPVDHHDKAYLGKVDFHTLGGYLSTGLTAAAVAPYL